MESEILEKIDVVLSDGLNMIWSMVCKNNRDNKKITINKQKDISGYLRELQKMLNEKRILLKIIMQKIESLITMIKNKIDVFNKKLHKRVKINKAEIESIKSIFEKFLR